MIKRINIKIFVSGTYDILHAGHVQFFKEAKALGYYLTVCFCSDKNLLLYKNRQSSIPEDHKRILIKSIRWVDNVVMGDEDGGVWDFVTEFLAADYDTLVVTEDDQYIDEKRQLCEANRRMFIVLPKSPPMAEPISTSMIINRIRAGV